MVPTRLRPPDRAVRQRKVRTLAVSAGWSNDHVEEREHSVVATQSQVRDGYRSGSRPKRLGCLRCWSHN